MEISFKSLYASMNRWLSQAKFICNEVSIFKISVGIYTILYAHYQDREDTDGFIPIEAIMELKLKHGDKCKIYDFAEGKEAFKEDVSRQLLSGYFRREWFYTDDELAQYALAREE